MSRPLIGLALGSGSARGLSHIGIIESLLEAGIEPDIVCGTSIGSLVGAAYVAGRLTELRLWAEALRWREIVGLLDVRPLRGGLIDGRQILGFLRRLDLTEPIESYAKPFAAIATDLMTGDEVRLTVGPIDDAVRASIALPGILSPMRIDDRWLVDGGLVNPVPVSACRAFGAEIVIAVNLNGGRIGRTLRGGELDERLGRRRAGRKELLARIQNQVPAVIREKAGIVASRLPQPSLGSPGYFDVIANSINIMQDQITRSRLAAERPEVTLAPNLREIGILEFNRANEAIAEGRACVARALPEIRAHCLLG
jgi:NTE family protein